MKLTKFLSPIIFAGLAVLINGTAWGLVEPDEWDETPSCPEFTNKDFVVLKGASHGKILERRYPTKGSDGFYPIVARVKAADGQIASEYLSVIKDTKPPKLTDLQYPRQTTDDQITVSGYVDGRPFSRQLDVPGKNREHYLDLSFTDEAGNRTNKKLKIIKDSRQLKGAQTVSEMTDKQENELGSLIQRLSGKVSGLKLTGSRSIQKQWSPASSSNELASTQTHTPAAQGASTTNSSPVSQDVPSEIISASNEAVRGPSPETSTPLSKELSAEAQLTDFMQSPKKTASLHQPKTKNTYPERQLTAQTAQPKMIVLEPEPDPVIWDLKDDEIEAFDLSQTPPKSKTSKEIEEGDFGFGITRKVRMPDENGGMTITIDNHRTGKRTIIRRDLTGVELSRQTITISDEKNKMVDEMKKIEGERQLEKNKMTAETDKPKEKQNGEKEKKNVLSS